MSAEAPQGTQAVIRAIGLLKAFRPEQPEMTPLQLSKSMGLTRATTHRLLSALESEGLLARNPNTNQYRLGPAIIALGTQAMLTSDLRLAVRPTLEELQSLTGETSTLEVLSGDQILILDGIVGKHLISASPDIGTHWPAHHCATGRAIFSALPETESWRILRHKVLPETPEGAEFSAKLDEARKRGYAHVVEELEPDYVAVAASFLGPMGQPEGAICVGGPKSRFGARRIKELGPLICDMADRLSQRHRLPDTSSQG